MDSRFTNKINVGLRYFTNGKVYGLCPKSVPIYPHISELIRLVKLCCGGESGTDLINLPYEGTILDQPNRFIQAYMIYEQEINEWKINLLNDESR